MIGHIGRARKGPRANADLDEYSNYCRRSPERLVGVQLRGGLWGMDRRAHSRAMDCGRVAEGDHPEAVVRPKDCGAESAASARPSNPRDGLG